PLFRSILALCPVNDLQFFVLIGQYKESRIRLPGKNRGLAGATKESLSGWSFSSHCREDREQPPENDRTK
ncbi:hypothetical protein, partial [Kushneria aurantia]